MSTELSQLPVPFTFRPDWPARHAGCTIVRKEPLPKLTSSTDPRPSQGDTPGPEGVELGRGTVAATASNGGDLQPQFLGYSLHVCSFRYTSQLLVQVVAARPLTCPIPKCPVTSKQFAELRLAAFEVLGHLHKGTTKMKGHDAGQVGIEEASTGRGGQTLRSISSASARSSSLCLSVSLLSIAMFWYSFSSRSIAC